MKERLKGQEIEIISPKDLNIEIEVDENGTTVTENAILKAQAYYNIAKMPTIVGYAALYIKEFEKQLGLYVHRINGKELTREELKNRNSTFDLECVDFIKNIIESNEIL